ncbi:phage antirepressor KilAC domain-containing protein [Burkholderia contaminans]|nr:phage antirepressor KilAC domain-containing protein [Burkholderia contaminans]
MNNGLMNFDPTQTVTMSSREIADLVGSRHDNVRVTIERLTERGVIALPAMQEKATGGRPSVEYVFSGEQGKRDSIVVVAQLSPEFTARLVDRWHELETQAAKPAFQIPQTLGEALRLAADLEEQRAALALENEAKSKLIAQQKPAVEFAEAVQASDGSITIGQLAKLLVKQGVNTGERRLRAVLKQDGFLMESGEPYQRHMKYFEVAVNKWETPSGRISITFVARITPEGEKYFLKRYGQRPRQLERLPNPPTTGLFKPRKNTEERKKMH